MGLIRFRDWGVGFGLGGLPGDLGVASGAGVWSAHANWGHSRNVVATDRRRYKILLNEHLDPKP